MSLSNLPAHLRMLLMFVVGAVVIVAGGVYGYMKMGEKNAGLRVELRQVEERKKEFEELASQLGEKEVEFLNAIGDLLQLDAGLKPEDYVPTALEEFRLWASQNRLMLASFRPGEVKTPPPAAKGEEKGEKAFEAEVGEILVGTVPGGEPWAILEKGKGKKGKEAEYEVLGVGGTVTTRSEKKGVVKKIGQDQVDVEFKKRTYTIKARKREADFMKLELAFEGTYEDFQRFLRSMNRFPKLVKVNEVSITKGGVEGNRLRLRLSTELFFVPEEVEKVLAEAKGAISGLVGVGPGASGLSSGDFGVSEATLGD